MTENMHSNFQNGRVDTHGAIRQKGPKKKKEKAGENVKLKPPAQKKKEHVLSDLKN